MMSWITATIAVAAIFHSKRNDRYSGEQEEEDDRAPCSAFRLTVSPHVGPTVVTLTSLTSTPAYFGERDGDVLHGARRQRRELHGDVLTVDGDVGVRSRRRPSIAFSTDSCVTVASLATVNVNVPLPSLVAHELHVGRFERRRVGERVLDGADRVLDDLGLHPHRLVAADPTSVADLGVGEPERVEEVAHVGDARRPCRRPS